MSVRSFQKRTVVTFKTNQEGGIGEIMTPRDNTILRRFAVGLDNGIFTGATGRLIIVLRHG